MFPKILDNISEKPEESISKGTYNSPKILKSPGVIQFNNTKTEKLDQLKFVNVDKAVIADVSQNKSQISSKNRTNSRDHTPETDLIYPVTRNMRKIGEFKGGSKISSEMSEKKQTGWSPNFFKNQIDDRNKKSPDFARIKAVQNS